MAKKLKVRRSLITIQNDYDNGQKKELEDLMRAWKGIKELPPNDPRSLFMLSGFHGEPFRGAGWSIANGYFWGGYCHHGNILFPTWHRVYLFKLEQALQSIKGCKDVMLPFWDETDEFALANGIPRALTDETFYLDGETIANPLRSFVLPVDIRDSVSTDNDYYSKPAGYETVRYPLSGLVGSESARKKTAVHNAKYPNSAQNVEILNKNVLNWLNKSTYTTSDGVDKRAGVYKKYVDCLSTPNYTAFSNTTSAQEWNRENKTSFVSIESPHNSIHLAVGGYDVNDFDPAQNGNFSAIAYANGDMGENDTAAFDPIFYFHHCFIDRVFWLWQKKWGKTNSLDIINFYPGTNSIDGQGATPGIAPNVQLNLTTPLDPFTKNVGRKDVIYTSMDCINIEKQLGYSYGPGSLEEFSKPEKRQGLAAAPNSENRVIEVSGINRAIIRGSFVLGLFANIDGKEVLVDHEAVLSRWAVAGCANCQNHLEVKAHFSLPPIAKKAAVSSVNTYMVKFLSRQQGPDTSLPTIGKALAKLNITNDGQAAEISYRLNIV